MEQFQFSQKTNNDFLKKFWLFVFLTFFSLGVKAQCPTGDVAFSSQAQLDDFAINYPNCTEITGNLFIGLGVNNLNGLSNLTQIGGHLVFLSSQLTNLNGLSNLTQIGGYLQINNNSQLTDLDGLSALESINGNLVIINNAVLTDISGLQNIDPASILPTYGFEYGLNIVSNSSLSVCNLDNFCTYLQGSGPRTISGNAGDCISEAAVNAACSPAPPGDAPTNLSTSNVTSVSATLNWSGTGTYDIEWGTQGFTQGTGTTVTNISTNSYSLTNLDYQTQYQFYVRSQSEPANWVGPFAFTTLSQCPTGDVYLGSQAEVDAFAINYPNCTEITGNLTIGYMVNNLNGLSHLTSVGGNLWIRFNEDLTNLEGLNNLQTVGGYLRISDSLSLTTLDGLSALTSVGGSLGIYENSNLTNLDGISNLTSVGGVLNINSNQNLTNLDGLSNLTSIVGDLLIQNNSSLTDISGLQNIDPNSISFLRVEINPLLSVCNLPNFCTYLQGSGPRTISGNAGDCISEAAVNAACNPAPPCDAPTNLSISNVTSVSATLNWSGTGTYDIEWGTQGFTPGSGTSVTGIASNSYSLTDLDYNTQYQFYVRCQSEPANWVGPFAFTTLSQCPTGDVNLFSQAYVNNFATNYPNCTEVSGELTIQGANITDLTPLSNIQSIGGYLFINNNSQLTNLDGLSNLTQIGGALYIQANSLTNLDGLSALESINGDLGIYNNPVLTDISGLQNIDPATISNGLGLYIVSNSSLSVCNLPNFCTYLQGSGPRTISDNAGDCISEAAVNAACTPACDAPTNLSISNVTSVSATLGWTSDGSLFDVEWGVAGFTPGSGTLITDITTNSYDLTNLDYATQYQFYVRRDCTLNESDWVGPFAFTTLSQCPTGDVTLNSQTDVNNFATNYPNCTEITGYLYIGGSNITDLSPLSNIQSVGGDLYIYNNSQLTNLDGLSNLTQIGGDLSISSNSQLTNLDGLSNLTQIGGYLYIVNNSQLTNLDGLSNLTQIGGYLNIQSNSQLTNLDGLSSLTSIEGELNIQHNSSLTDISGLQNIDPTSILPTYGLSIVNNSSLSVCNLPNFCTYLQGSGARTISGNAGDCISEAAVNAACTTSQEPQCPTGDVMLYSQAAVDAFAVNYPNCTQISGHLVIGALGGTDIVNLEGLSNVTSVGDFLLIGSNHDLTTLDGLNNLTSVGGHLNIGSNNVLTTLDGLSNLTSVGGDLFIGYTSLITTLDGLSNLESINGTLEISINATLTDISGLENIDPSTISGLTIINNANLSVCNIANFCTYLSNPDNPRTISDNAGDCISEAAVNAACSPAPPCDAPTNLSTSNVTSVSATLNWSGTGTYDIEWGTQGFTPGSGTTVTGIASNSYSLTNLDYQTQYQFYVRCQSEPANWVGPFAFTTLSQCPPQNVGHYFNYLSTQAEVNAFGVNYPNCTTLSYNLYIGREDYYIYPSNITNLDGLSNLTTIEGDLTIKGFSNLTNIDGLTNMTTIGGKFEISSTTLNNLDALSNLTSIGGDFTISLSIVNSFDVLNNLTSIGGDFWVTVSGVTSLEGLNNLSSIGGQVSFWGTSFTNLDGLNNLTSIGGELGFAYNNSLNNLAGLSNVTSIGGGLSFAYNNSLTNLDGLSNLTSIGRNIFIFNNPSLINLNGLQNIDPNSISGEFGLHIVDNPSLSVCNLPNFCTYLHGSGPRTISGNAEDCISEEALLAICPPPTCDVPANLTVSGIIHNKATINWTNSGTFDLKWGAENFTDGNELGTANGVTALNYEITGLTANTAYDVYVRQNCDVNQSEWVKYTFSTTVQCPSGYVNLLSQTQVSNFLINYPNCTHLPGSLHIQGNNIANLTPLSNLVSIGQHLTISGNPALTSLNGLSSLTFIGGELEFYNNNQLTDISALQNVEGMTSLYVVNNSSLSDCDIDSFCSYLSNPDNPRTISGNAGNCITEEAITLICFPPTPSCELPTNLATTNITVDSATLNWESDGASFEIVWGALGFDPEGATPITDIDTTSYTISEGLNAGTQYDFYVRQYCTDDDIVSDWAGPFGFATSVAECPSGDVVFNTQAELDAFAVQYPNCTAITGNLLVNDTGNNITSLSALNAIESVSGALLIINNFYLPTIDGLSSLTTVGGHLQITNNYWLTDLDGLSNLTSLGADITIAYNDNLTSVSGLSGLTTINPVYNEGLRLFGNMSLTTCEIDVFCDYLSHSSDTHPREIHDNGTNCNDEAEIYAACNPPVACSDGDIFIGSQEDLDDYVANYPLCTIINGSLFIEESDISDLSGLNNIATITGDLYISGNQQLTTLNGLSSLETIGGGLFIWVNDNLQDVDGLSSLNTIGGALNIDANPALQNLEGLNSLVSIGEDIAIFFTGLINLDGLSNLTSLGADISIGYNDNLEDISGLSGLTTLIPLYDFGLQIFNNPSLSTCNLSVFCDYLSNDPETHPRWIEDNAGDCISEEAVQESCEDMTYGDCDFYTIWNGSQWSHGAPNAETGIVIKGNLNLTEDLEVCDVWIISGVLSVEPGVQLTLNGAIVNNMSADYFLVQSDAVLIQMEGVENLGEITVIRESQDMIRLDYTLWSSPVTGQNLFGFSPETVNGVTNYPGSAGRIYIYDGANGYVNPNPFNAESVMEDGVGYLFRSPNNWSSTDAAPYIGKFIGAPNNGNIQVATHAGNYTSIGNPYPSNIRLNDLYVANPDINAVYFWNNLQSTGNNYATCTNGMGCVAAAGGGNTPNGILTTGQGFIVHTDANSVSFDNSMRVNDSGIFFKVDELESHRFWLNLDGENESYNQILVGYVSEATHNIDPQIDGKLFNYEGSALYNLIDEEQFVIQGRALPFEAEDVVSLGFRAAQSGKFKISLANFDGLFVEGSVSIYLKDNQLDITHNLMESDYEFESVQGEFKERFEVVYETEETMGTGEFDSNLVQIYQDNGNIIIESKNEKILSVELFDLNGRNLHRNPKVNANHYEIQTKAFGTQVLVVKVQAENGEILTKKLISK